MHLFSALYNTTDPFGIFDGTTTIQSPDQLKEGGALLLNGGEDISPSIYKQRVSQHCHASPTPSTRDKIELAMIERATQLKMPIIGICRGAQLLCAVDGGHLVQHIVGHGTAGHFVLNPDTEENLGKSNSAHHQMMQPRKSRDTIILGIVKENLYGFEENNVLRSYKNCPEIVLFKKQRALGVQGHPEWLSPNHPYVEQVANYIRQYLLRK